MTSNGIEIAFFVVVCSFFRPFAQYHGDVMRIQYVAATTKQNPNIRIAAPATEEKDTRELKRNNNVTVVM